MEPKRIMLVEPVTLHDGKMLLRWTQVWKIGEEGDGRRVVIEYKDREYGIPASSAVETPVPAPSLATLAERDSCFKDLEHNLRETYRDDAHMFIFYRCSHGNLFLEDTRGGIAMYSVMIFIGQLEVYSNENLERLWKKFHDLPVYAIYYLGIGR